MSNQGLTQNTILEQYRTTRLVLDNPQCKVLTHRLHGENGHPSSEQPQGLSFQVVGVQELFLAKNEIVFGGIGEIWDHL
jgi:hypothetical protein